MSYQISIVDINDPAVDSGLRQLILAANPSSVLLPESFLSQNISSKASGTSFFLVAKEHNRIIGCNAFIANDFLLNRSSYVGYQSCWTATHPLYQGKGVFSTLITEAKKILQERNAGFIYGIANDNSNPIFTKKLGFVETGSVVLRIPNIPFLRDSYLDNKGELDNAGACMINEQQVMEHKLLQHPDEIKLVRFNGSWLWGRLVNKTKFGIKLPVFYVGGVSLAAAEDLQGLLSGIHRSHRVAFIQFFCCANSTFMPLLKGWKRSGMNGFIFYRLNMPEPEHLNLMIGPLDVF